MSTVPREVHPLLWPQTAVPAWIHPTGRAYLQSRGLSQQETEAYQLHFCPDGFWQDRILIPVFHAGELVAFQGRTVVRAEPRYRTAGRRPLYVPKQPKTGQHLFVVEGPYDLWALLRAGYMAVATLGIMLSMDQKQQLHDLVSLISPSAITIWFDPDSEAQRAAFGLQLILNRTVPTQVLVLPHIKDPGSLSSEAIKEVARNFLT